MRTSRLLLLAVSATLALGACAPVEQPAAPAPGGGSTSDAGTDGASGGTLPTLTDGVLTFATSDPAYEPWVAGNDPTSGEGFESAVAYAVAERLGYAAEDVAWVTASFDQIIAPGAKSFDLAVNQVSISDERRENLDFSSSYYDTAQAVVTLGDSPVAGATSLAELADARIGAMVATTSAQVATEVIAPSTPVQQFNDNDQVKQALEAGLVDAIVVDLPTALYITAAELDDGVLVGQLPPGDSPDQLGFVLDKGSPLTEPVSEAVDELREDGTLAALEEQWLTESAGAPVLQ